MITIATVLRSGGDYGPEHVEALRRMCARHAPAHRFVCLTDMPDRVGHGAIELHRDWPGWWAKMEMFWLRAPVLYLDLDTVIVRDIGPLIDAAAGREFVILRDFYRGQSNPRAMQSAMMFWAGDQSRLADGFEAQPRFYLGGDQEYLEQHLGFTPDYWQDIAPGAVGSFKVSPRTADERVIIFHGRPRPWEQNEIEYAAA